MRTVVSFAPTPFTSVRRDGECPCVAVVCSALRRHAGDANFRRLIGDRHWPWSTRPEDVLSYFPAPLLALRTCKSEVLIGSTDAAVDVAKSRSTGTCRVVNAGCRGLLR